MPPAPVRWCMALVRWFPVVFITAVVVWSYYAYVIYMCFVSGVVDTVAEQVILLLLYHPFFLFFGWSYWQAIYTEPGKTPKQFYLSEQDVARFESSENEEQQRQILAKLVRDRNLPVQCRTATGAYRYCEKCKCIKPDRAHHCSMCGTCILKMDHHCPWVNNCVSFTNYKFFVIFLGYALLYCLYVTLTVLKYFIRFWTQGGFHNDLGRFHILFLFFASVMFSISLISLFGYHVFLTLHNRSTLESFRAPIFRTGPDKNGFSLGKRANFQEIFGDDRKKWFLPVFTSLGDGLSFPTRVDANVASSYNTMSETNPATASPSFGDGVTYPTRTEDIDSDTLLGARQRWAEEGGEEETSPVGTSKVHLINER
ncbi:palmitoyltransferase ZDHHC15 isoform X1 [Lingula anatina]|uniref:Palmitoyltransferase n=1 Tax=Lingula anatina TaxID=7574 RepID=A0A1S3HR50_LINAN|nr:palmitoyltransferase ZDHHC15 isoform X2 [Lingula anatina]XP_013387526.1 palmitoyltransferase ZDHHC15 isoform X1 [Lingula anatina]|eukprot:XP_013387524.1 palmitoyltransferase ZDHHC15 isoform X2 [Lingula anatina]